MTPRVYSVVWRPDRSPDWPGGALPPKTGTKTALVRRAREAKLEADLHDPDGRYVARIFSNGKLRTGAP